MFARTETTPQYTLQTWQTDDGLPQNAVQTIVQTRDGYLWVGTRDGLARFDGARFVTFESKTTPELKNEIIQVLCEAEDGSLWIGTDGGGVTILKDGKFSHIGKNEGLAGDQIRTLMAAKEGVMWIGTTTGLTRYKDGQFKNFGPDDGLCSAVVRGLAEDKQGDLWVAASTCLSRLQDGNFTNFGVEWGLVDRTVRSVLLDRSGALWVGSNNGLSRRKEDKVSTFTKDKGLSGGFIISLFEDKDGVIWVGGYAGLDQIVDGEVVSEISDDGAFNALVYTICQDREGNIWVGSKDGLSRFSPKRCHSYTKQNGLIHNTTVSVCTDRQGTLWVGTWGGGIGRWKNGVFSSVPVPHPFYNHLVLAITESREGGMWIGTDYGSGVYRWRDGQVQRFADLEGIRGSEMSVLYEDSRTNLWIGTRAGLTIFRGDRVVTNYASENGLAHNTVRVVYEDSRKDIWVGTDGGLSRWRDGSFENFTTQHGLSQNAVCALHEDADGRLWIGTRGGGLCCRQDEKFTAWTTAQGLVHDYIYEIIEGDGDWLWLSSPKGVFVVSRKELDMVAQGKLKNITCVYYGKSDGMLNSECKGVAKPAGCRTPDGHLWFPTSKGLVAVDPTVKVREVPPVLIEEVGINGKTFDNQKKEIVAGRQQFLFRYTALSFVAPEKVKFKHWLEGMDNDWIDAGNRREASYTHLPPGDYKFHVIAASGDGVWNEKGAIFEFRVVPPFWQAGWFIVLLALSGIGMITGGVYFVSVKNIQRKLRRLEQQHAIEKERMRIARDMHDDLGGSLTQISILSDMARRDLSKPADVEAHVRKIAESARKTTQSLEEIVWAVHPENDTLDHLANYLCQFAEEFFRPTTVRCRVDMPAFVPPYPLSAEMRHNLFLIVKESLNNALKYADASEIWLRLSVSSSYFTLAVEDNGRGFDVEKNATAGNGLRNLQKRASDIGGRLAFDSAPGKGTRLKVTIDLKE